MINEDISFFLPDPISAEGAVAICSNSSYDYARLKDMLIRSFHIQFRMGQVYWPKRFQSWQRDCFALEGIVQRITLEYKNALYYGRLFHYVNGASDDIERASSVQFLSLKVPALLNIIVITTS